MSSTKNFEFVEEEGKQIDHQIPVTIGVRVFGTKYTKLVAGKPCTAIRSYFKHLDDEERTKEIRQKVIDEIIQTMGEMEECFSDFIFSMEE